MNSKNPAPIHSAIPNASVVLFEQDGEPVLGLVTGLKKDKHQIISERGRALEFLGTRLQVFELRAKINLSSSEQQQFLKALKSQCQNLAASINLEELWETVVDFPRSYSSDELAELSFAQASPEQKLAMKILLLTDRAYFKRDKDLFVARPASVVEELKKAHAVNLEKQRLRAGLLDFFKRTSVTAENLPEEYAPLILLLKRFAIGAELSASEEREAKELVELALEVDNKDNFRVAPFAAYSILERLGIFNSRTNPAFERSAIPGRLSIHPEDLDSAYSVDADSNREDFTQLDVFTIDDITTLDMDDALSLESTENGYRLGIHISDVAAEIPLESRLDKKISSRLTSVYLPDQTIHMLPNELSQQRLSLLQAEKRRAMSMLVEIDKSYKILKTRIVPSWVIVKRRWTYDQVDNLLETANSELNTFYEIASAFEAERLEKGAMHVQKTEILVSVDESGKVSLKEIDEQSPARALVAEMAVLTNRIAAEFCRDNRIPVIFRGQSEPDPVDEVKPEEGPARDHFIRVRLKRSESALTAIPHAGLGLPAYLQITSPIRRYVDLINQRQLMAFIDSRGLPYSFSDLEQIRIAADEGLLKIQKLSKESKRFWLLRYLQQRISRLPENEGRKISGVVVRLTAKNPLVELDEVFFSAFVKSNRKLSIGERVQMTIGAIDPREDYIRLEVV